LYRGRSGNEKGGGRKNSVTGGGGEGYKKSRKDLFLLADEVNKRVGVWPHGKKS